jgi:Domain of unknown function (DUF4194)
MNCSDEARASTEDNTEHAPMANAGLFAGDTGELPLDTRRVLAQLLAGPSLDGRRHSKLWPALIRDETLIRARLCELFLDLVIDPDLQVAFTRRADVGDLDAPVLLRVAHLTLVDSVLLLVSRDPQKGPDHAILCKVLEANASSETPWK